MEYDVDAPRMVDTFLAIAIIPRVRQGPTYSSFAMLYVKLYLGDPPF